MGTSIGRGENNGVGAALCSLSAVGTLLVRRVENTRGTVFIARKGGPHMVPSTQDLQGSLTIS